MTTTSGHEPSKRRLGEAEQALRFQDAIAAGVNPSALVEAINKAKAQRDAIQAELANQSKPACWTRPRSTR